MAAGGEALDVTGGVPICEPERPVHGLARSRANLGRSMNWWDPSLPPTGMRTAGRQPSLGRPLRLASPISVLAAVRLGRNVVIVPPVRPVSATPTHRSWAFNAEAMIPPGMDPVAQ